MQPGHTEFCWEGYNRAACDRRGGGVGVLFRQDLGWSRLHPECRKHAWLEDSSTGQRTAVVVVYMWCRQDDREPNKKPQKCLRVSVR